MVGSVFDDALELHSRLRGKISVQSKFPVRSRSDLSLVYTPGVAGPCRAIASDRGRVYDYTMKGNSVAVVSDGSAVLGLGNIGAEASIPVMEGKCLLFKELAGIDAFPVCLSSQDERSIVETVVNIAPVFGGINLEDISAPKCFSVEDALREKLDVPVMHDDQHGTAIVVLAAFINAMSVSGKSSDSVRVVISGAGAAGVAVARMLIAFGVQDLVLVDKAGIIYKGRKEDMNPYKEELARITNLDGLQGSLADAVRGADMFIGLSAPGVLSSEMVASMSEPVVFAMANPVPEIMPEDALRGGAVVVATGRSDFANQINNSLSFPGVFRGALDVRASIINEDMKLAAARAIASLVEPSRGCIVPEALDRRIVPAVAKAVAEAAVRSGVAQR